MPFLIPILWILGSLTVIGVVGSLFDKDGNVDKKAVQKNIDKKYPGNKGVVSTTKVNSGGSDLGKPRVEVVFRTRSGSTEKIILESK